jgi:hypothetical protein
MSKMEKVEIREVILEAMEAGLEAQLRAVRRLRQPHPDADQPRRERGMSQTDLAYDILQKARRPLHINEIIERAAKTHGARLDRESLGSAMVKRVARGDRFVRTAPNTFALREEEEVRP